LCSNCRIKNRKYKGVTQQKFIRYFAACKKFFVIQYHFNFSGYPSRLNATFLPVKKFVYIFFDLLAELVFVKKYLRMRNSAENTGSVKTLLTDDDSLSESARKWMKTPDSFDDYNVIFTMYLD
jgi:hypothetical protein